MNQIVQLHDRSMIATWLRENVAMNMFGLCDLDRSEWHLTRWLGLREGDKLCSVLLIYASTDGPLAILHGPSANGIKLLEMSRDLLPKKFYLSLAMPLGCNLVIRGADLTHHADYLRMVPGANTGKMHSREELVRLTVNDAERVRQLLFADQAYPDAWFNEQTLRSGLYRGWVERNELLGVAGVHAASAEFRVAVTGNLAVRPDARGKGIAQALKEDLLRELDVRGWQSAFNVRPENALALALHTRMGAQVVGTVREFSVTLLGGRSFATST